MKSRIDYLARNDEDRILLNHMADKVRRLSEENWLQTSHFLTTTEQQLVDELMHFKGAPSLLFHGGYEHAVRKIPIFLPDYITPEDQKRIMREQPDEDPLSYLRFHLPKNRPLQHKDFLGSLMALGLKRQVIGDILPTDGSCDIVVLKELRDFIAEGLTKAGRVGLRCEILQSSADLIVPETTLKDEEVILPSLRLDAYISAVFRLSRQKAQTMVSGGLVTRNGAVETKIARTVNDGDEIVLRRYGKTVCREVVGKTRKDHLILHIRRYC